MNYLKIYAWNAEHVGIKIYNDDSKKYYALIPSGDDPKTQNDNIKEMRLNLARITPYYEYSYAEDRYTMLNDTHKIDVYFLRDFYISVNKLVSHYEELYNAETYEEIDRGVNYIITMINRIHTNLTKKKKDISNPRIIQLIKDMLKFNFDANFLDYSSKHCAIPPTHRNSLLLNKENHIRREMSEAKVPIELIVLKNGLTSIAADYEKRGIKLTKLKPEFDEHNVVQYKTYVGRQPKQSYIIEYGGTKDTWFGLSLNRIIEGIKEYHNSRNPIHHNHGLYYKKYSRYHNCIGYVRYILEFGGINCFVSSKELEGFGVTRSDRLNNYMTRVKNAIDQINLKANNIFDNDLKYLNPVKLHNYLKKYERFPEDGNIEPLIRKYNAEHEVVVSNKKLSILLQIVNKLNINNRSIAQKQFITDLAFEIKRLYSLS